MSNKTHPAWCTGRHEFPFGDAHLSEWAGVVVDDETAIEVQAEVSSGGPSIWVRATEPDGGVVMELDVAGAMALHAALTEALAATGQRT